MHELYSISHTTYVPPVTCLPVTCLQPPQPFLVMELMLCSLGDVLRAWTRGKGLPLGVTLSVALDVARGLEHLHGLKPRGVLHRWVGAGDRGGGLARAQLTSCVLR